MSNKFIEQYDGDWNIPEIDYSMPGVLTINKEDHNIELKLITEKDFSGKKIDIQNPSFHKIEILNGKTWNDYITLYNLLMSNVKVVGNNHFEYNFKIEFVIFGGIFNTPKDINLNSITCSFPFFVSWYDGYKDYFESSLTRNGVDSEIRTSLKKDELTDIIEVNPDFKIEIFRRYILPPLISSVRKLDISIKHFIKFIFIKPVSFDIALEYVHYFKQLIQFATGNLTYVDFSSIITQISNTKFISDVHRINEKEVSLQITNFSKLHKRNLGKSDYIHQNFMLFCICKNTKNELHSIIRNWYLTIKEYIIIYNIFLDTDEWFQNTNSTLTQVMFNNRFLNLIQALEGYYNIKNPNKYDDLKIKVQLKLKGILDRVKIEPTKDRKWIEKRIMPFCGLADKLNTIYNQFEKISNILFVDKKALYVFTKSINDIRNGFSHGATLHSDFKKNWNLYYYKLQIILLCCILESLKFSNEQIFRMILKCTRFSEIIGFIKHHEKQLNIENGNK
ncbi:MAG: hypothetical protein JXA16_11135 [Bacteroidales bacterium]|nr:hypothetical protein [Bacteroidales bacterium]